MTSDASLNYTNSVSSLPIATLLLLCLVLFLLFIKKFLFCKNRSTNIRLFYDDNQFNQEVISLIPQLTRDYTPPCWIRNRIVATLTFGTYGRYSYSSNSLYIIQRYSGPVIPWTGPDQ